MQIIISFFILSLKKKIIFQRILVLTCLIVMKKGLIFFMQIIISLFILSLKRDFFFSSQVLMCLIVMKKG